MVAGKFFDLFLRQHLREANVAFLFGVFRFITRDLDALNFIFNKSFNLLFSSLLLFLRLSRCLQLQIRYRLSILLRGIIFNFLLRMRSVKISRVELVTFPLHDSIEVTHRKQHFDIAHYYQNEYKDFVDYVGLKLISAIVAFHLKIPIKLLVKLDYKHNEHEDVLK